jgi:hypothetical protein
MIAKKEYYFNLIKLKKPYLKKRQLRSRPKTQCRMAQKKLQQRRIQLEGPPAGI